MYLDVCLNYDHNTGNQSTFKVRNQSFSNQWLYIEVLKPYQQIYGPVGLDFDTQ